MGNNTVIVVGGGAAGIMAAIAASKNNHSVILIEKNNQLGKKLSITGGGRCNVTNIDGPEAMILKTVNNGRFLYSALNHFNSSDLMALLKHQGVPLKVEEGGRVFPISNQSGDILKALHQILQDQKVVIRYNSQGKRILLEDGCIKGLLLTNGEIVLGNTVILATGGLSYPATGSSGEGLSIAKAMGHTVIPPRAALVPIETEEEWVKDLMGISLEQVRIFTVLPKNKRIEVTGSLIFTHFGISGPAVLQFSSYVNQYTLLNQTTMQLDLVPKLTQGELEDFFLKAGKNNGNKQLKSLLFELLPKGFTVKLLSILKIDGEVPLNQLKKSDRNLLLNSLKGLKLTIKQLRSIKEAIITAGGVSVKEINPKTMESKLLKGLYFVGEMVDVDALTGGYNLQIAFSTGYLAGNSIN